MIPEKMYGCMCGVCEETASVCCFGGWTLCFCGNIGSNIRIFPHRR